MVIAATGVPAFGSYAVLVALPVMLNAADFGLGQALTTMVARSRAGALRHREEHLALVTFGVLSAVGVVALIVIVAISAVLGSYIETWSAETIPSLEARESVIVAGVAVAMSIPGTTASRLLWGQQRGYLATPLGMVAWIGTLAAVFLTTRYTNNFAVIVASSMLVPSAVGLGTTAYLVRPRIRKYLRARTWLVPALRDMWSLGWRYFALNLAALVAIQTDLIVINSLAGGAAATEYAIVSRVFYIVMVALNLAVSPLFPGFADAQARGDLAWIRKALRNALFASAFVAILGVVVVWPVAPRLMSFLSDGQITSVSVWLLLGFSIWLVLAAILSPVGVLLSSSSVPRAQIVGMIAMACVNVPLSIGLTGRFGSAGAIWGTSISYAVVLVPAYAFAIRSLLRLTEPRGPVIDTGR
jgi:O-antigen/teichoic acid export membrane protein